MWTTYNETSHIDNKSNGLGSDLHIFYLKLNSTIIWIFYLARIELAEMISASARAISLTN